MRDEEGAVAIMVAIMSIVLVSLLAFAVDFGNAYAVKRKLSVAADSAVLAAGFAVNAVLPAGKAKCDLTTGRVVAKNAADLTDYQLNAETQANLAVAAYNSRNDLSGEATISTVTVSCDTDGVKIAAGNTQTVPTFFGGIMGVDSTSPTGSATSIIQVPRAVPGLRPIAACSEIVAPGGTLTTTNFVIYLSRASGVCDTAGTGEWGWVNFLDQGSSGTFTDPGSCGAGGNVPCARSWIDDGYQGPVYIPNRFNDPMGNQALSANSGFSQTLAQNLRALVGQEISVPVATGLAGSPPKRLDTVGVATVEVCSINEGQAGGPPGGPPVTIYPPAASASPCGENQPPVGSDELPVWNALPNNTFALYVKPIPDGYASSGIFGGSDCQLGDTTCDFGTRGVALFE